jgi:hypothetical protein
MLRRLALVLLAAIVVAAPACRREKQEGSNAASIASSAPSASASAPAAATPERFCAFMESLIVKQMNKTDRQHMMPLAMKQKQAKEMNADCVKSITTVAAKDPEGWQKCGTCLMSKPDFDAQQACDAICRTMGVGAPAPSGSTSASQ